MKKNLDMTYIDKLFDYDVSGKKLLILGAYRTEIEIVNAAKKMGLYTITTDNHSNWDDAPAKKESDEAWDISWSDLATLREKCLSEKIDGVMAGFSEKRITYANTLAEMLDKPFYAKGSDLRTITNKKLFKKSCIDAGVRVPMSYEIGSDIHFPVIIKPCDNGGSKGVTVCYTLEELIHARDRALQSSDNNEIIIEEYLNGDEVMVYFTVHNGEITLSAMCERIMKKFDKNITQLPVGYYFPSKHINTFIESNLAQYKELIRLLKIRNGLIAFQAFVKGKDVIPYDPTYRLDGTIAYHMIEKRNYINVLQMLIYHSLTGSMGNDKIINQLENPFFKSPTFELPILLGKGRISRIEGIEEIKKIDGVVHVYKNKGINDTMEFTADFSQIFCRIHLCLDTKSEINERIKKIFQLISVLDENGHDMIINRDISLI